MHKNVHFHLIHYFFLVSILAAGLVSFLYFSAFPNRQFGVVIITSILYFIWGMAHHFLDGDLHLKIVIEYMLIALLSVVLLKGVILR